MTLEKVKQIINKNKFPSELKSRLYTILPNLNDYCLSGLGRELSKKESILILTYLTELWENFAQISTGFKKNEHQAIEIFFKLLIEKDSLTNEDDRLYFLNLVLDIRTGVESIGSLISDQRYEEILKFEISLFWFLPKEEIIFFLQERLLFLESQIDLLEYIKAIVWENDWDYKKDFSKSFSDLLLKNKEELGGKTVGEWVKDYFNFSSPSSFRADVVQVAEFLIKDPSVQKLAEQERKTLSEILKLYVWFLKPEMNEDEILAYKEEIRQRQAEIAEQSLLKEIELSSGAQNSQGAKPTSPTVPTPKNQPIQKPIQEIVKLAPPPEILAKPVVKPVNIEEVLKKKPVEEVRLNPNIQFPISNEKTKDKQQDLEAKLADVGSGLKMWSGQPPEMPKKPMVDIDKKLEDLKKKVQK